jgi:ABC-type Mn2+/Zn2+ transport system permease subunit
VTGSRPSSGRGATALALVGALALGVVLASDVFHSGSEVDTLLFGSLLSIAGRDPSWLASAASGTCSSSPL